MPPLYGTAACAAWIGQVLDEVRRDLSGWDLVYATIEVHVSGGWAFERGSFTHTFRWRATTDRGRESGSFVRIYSRTAAGSWKVARIIWTLDGPSEPVPYTYIGRPSLSASQPRTTR